MITGEKMIYYSPFSKCLKIFDLFTEKITETWPDSIEVPTKFNFAMWLSYNHDSKKALFLYMDAKNHFVLQSFKKSGEKVKMGECECKSLNVVCEEGGVLYFSHNIGKELVINVASEQGLSSITFISPKTER
jgi:hypothetical protein